MYSQGGAQKIRARVVIHGAVQGVGFRPFVYRLATEIGLNGWVNNTSAGVFIEVEGARNRVDAFTKRVASDKPPAAFIQSLETSYLDPVGLGKFEIVKSNGDGPKTTVILPDLATCPDCLRELFDPRNRRYRYPFINCTNCGPRFSIVNSLPYDRPNTTMFGFPQCPACLGEYRNPVDRRFHAQPNACSVCGPRVALWNTDGWTLECDYGAVQAAVDAIAAGHIVAVKGLGGFQLLADARSEEAVRELRRRKHRAEKAFAVMYPTLDSARRHCVITDLEERLLLSPQAPIVLLEKRSVRGAVSRPADFDGGPIASAVAPDNPALGVMLPYTPLHHLIMSEFGSPVVATSGNLSDEPICIDEHEALDRLGGIADVFLVHDRPIARHVDDSVVRIVMGRELVLRRARGYAPLPVQIPTESKRTVVAYGAHQKCAAATVIGSQVFVGQHIGDLETAAAVKALARTVADLPRLYDRTADIAVCDPHPDYASTRLAENAGIPIVKVQHHYAHVLSCMAENELTGPVLGVSWDGTGLGLDGTIWGGEFLAVDDSGFSRVAHLRPFLLPGGESAVRQPRRTALAILFALYGDDAFSMTDLSPVASFSSTERGVIKSMLAQQLNSPSTTSAGRLFDAAAALAGLRQRTGFEGQAAMLLEYAAHRRPTEDAYPISILRSREPELFMNSSWKTGGTSIPRKDVNNATGGTPIPRKDVNNAGERGTGALTLDWSPAVEALIADIRGGRPVERIAALFHNALVDGIVEVATRIGIERVALTGGCFQNKYLTERTIQRLRDAGLRPYWHQRIPPNDGGIALGQIIAAIRS